MPQRNNLLDAITFDNGAGTNEGITYGNNTVANGQIATPANNGGNSTNVVGATTIGGTPYAYLQVFSPDYGAAYNSTAVAESHRSHPSYLACESCISQS